MPALGMYFIYYFRMTGQAYHKVHKLHPHRTQPLHIKPELSSSEPPAPWEGIENILEEMWAGQRDPEHAPGWHSMAPTLSQLPGSGPTKVPLLAAPGTARDPPSRLDAAGGWLGAGGCAACPARTPPSARLVQGRQSGAVCQCQAGDGGPHAALLGGPSVLAGTAAAPSLAGVGLEHRRFACRLLILQPPPNPPRQRGGIPPGTGTPLRAAAVPKEVTVTGEQGSTSSPSLKRSHLPPAPPKAGDGAGTAREHHGSRPGWQGWICTKRREEERAKVELTYRWLFKSIKGR